jgi:hypothetical protein
MDFKVGSRGWGYILEEYGLHKGDFPAAEALITQLRKTGDLPLDICADDAARATIGIERVDDDDTEDEADSWIEHLRSVHESYLPISSATPDLYVLRLGCGQIEGTVMGRVSLALLLWLVGSGVAWCEDTVMQFTAIPPDQLIEKFMGNHAWTIYATGEIDAEAGKRLAKLIADKHIPAASLLYLHSPGGSLLGGMELGRVIRANLLFTYIGQFNAATKPQSKPGYCYSACALAFLGGEYRYLPKGSVYGVHRFFWKESSAGNADVAQIVSAAVVEYIKSMGVDTKIFALASQAGSTEAVTPSSDELLALNVINEGRKPVKWTIESLTGAIYLKGEQETALGMNKFMLTCPARGSMELYVIFDAGKNTDEVMSWQTNWLFVDGGQMEIDDRLLEKKVLNGWINLSYRVDVYCGPVLRHAAEPTQAANCRSSTAS